MGTHPDRGGGDASPGGVRQTALAPGGGQAQADVDAAEHQSTRIRAAILLASNVKTPAGQIARMWLTDESHVRKVIHEFNEEGFDSLRPDYRGGRPRRITTSERQRAVAVAGARPNGQGVGLTRWSLDRLSAYLAELGVLISPIHLWRLLAQAGLSFQRTRSWKASPDPDYETRAARVLELYAACPFDGPVISFDQMDRSASNRSRVGCSQAPGAVARDLQPPARCPLHLRCAGRPSRPALRADQAPTRWQRRSRVHANHPAGVPDPPEALLDPGQPQRQTFGLDPLDVGFGLSDRGRRNLK